MKIIFEPIGTVHNEIHCKEDLLKSDIISEISLDEKYQPGLMGIEKNTFINVLFYFDKAEFDITKNLTGHKQGDVKNPLKGVFALRTPNRPNRIGLTLVRVIDIVDNVIKVEGLDCFNSTPVLDIKPYNANFDKML